MRFLRFIIAVATMVAFLIFPLCFFRYGIANQLNIWEIILYELCAIIVLFILTIQARRTAWEEGIRSGYKEAAALIATIYFWVWLIYFGLNAYVPIGKITAPVKFDDVYSFSGGIVNLKCNSSVTAPEKCYSILGNGIAHIRAANNNLPSTLTAYHEQGSIWWGPTIKPKGIGSPKGNYPDIKNIVLNGKIFVPKVSINQPLYVTFKLEMPVVYAKVENAVYFRNVTETITTNESYFWLLPDAYKFKLNMATSYRWLFLLIMVVMSICGTIACYILFGAIGYQVRGFWGFKY